MKTTSISAAFLLLAAPFIFALPKEKRGVDEEEWMAINIAPVKHSSLVGDPGVAPQIPQQFPSEDQSLMISGALLEAPLITETLAMVTRVVPADLLNIPPSTYVSGSTVTYRGNAANTCYWPAAQCIRTADGNGYIRDVYTCLGARQWGITFDDGPTSVLEGGVHTSDSIAISNQLRSMGLLGTYFVTGSQVLKSPAALKELDVAGHQIASHTWTHHPLTSLTNAQIVAEIKYTEAIIYREIGKIPTYMRPPYGDVDDRVRAIVNAMGYRVALWDRDSQDASVTTTTPQSAAQVVATVVGWANSNTSFVSLEHDINPFTSKIAVDALKAIAARGTLPLRIMPVGTCNQHAFYSLSSNSTSNFTAPVPTARSPTITATVQSTVTPTLRVEFGADKLANSNDGHQLRAGLAAMVVMFITVFMM